MNELPPQVLVGLLTLAVVVLVRLRPRRATTRRLVVGPCVVMVVGALVLAPSVATTTSWHVGPTVAVIVADLVLTVGLGMLRGATVRLEQGGAGEVTYRYTAATLVLWVISVALRFELAAAGTRIGAAQAATEASVLFALGLSLLAQNLVVARATARRRGRTDENAPGEPAEPVESSTL